MTSPFACFSTVLFYNCVSEVFAPGIEQPGGGGEDDYTPSSNAEVRNSWRYTSTLPYVFMTWCLIKLLTTLPFTFIITDVSVQKRWDDSDFYSGDNWFRSRPEHGLSYHMILYS
jgi:hypothetical protein